MELQTAYAFGRTVGLSFAEAESKVRQELAKEGFGILTEIDVKQKFAEKLQLEFRDYVILGACHPPTAYEALSVEIDLGTLLPCNVVVYTREDGRTAVMAMDPVAVLNLIDNSQIAAKAEEIAGKLRRVLAAL